MKRILLLVLLSTMSSFAANAQGLHGRILIIHSNRGSVTDSLDSVIPQIYSGVITSDTSLPTDLSVFDAILVAVPPESSSDSLTVGEQMKLIEYVNDGGKLYLESSGFFTGNDPFIYDSSTQPLADTLVHFLGLRHEGVDALEDAYSEFFGVDSEFTHGLDAPHFNEPTEEDVSGTYYPVGALIPVLLGQEVGMSEADIFAWIPSDTALHAVTQYHPAFGYGHPSEYYRPFMIRVLCDYFGLCTDVVTQEPSQPLVSLRIVYDAAENVIKTPSAQPCELEISNDLGITVFSKHVFGSEPIEVPSSLPNGVYFARLTSNGVTITQAFTILQK